MGFVTDKDVEYMQLALAQARLAPARGEVPIAAVLVREGQVLAQVHNFREAWQDPIAHAEIVAIREAAREKAAGERCLTPCKPCLTQPRLPRLRPGQPKLHPCWQGICKYRSIIPSLSRFTVSPEDFSLAACCGKIAPAFVSDRSNVPVLWRSVIAHGFRDRQRR